MNILSKILFLHEPDLLCLLSVHMFQVLLSKGKSFIYSHLNSFNNCYPI